MMQHKNIENSWIIGRNLVLSLPISLFTVTCASCCLPQQQRFSFLEHSTPQSLNVTSVIRVVYSLVIQFENGFRQVDITDCLHKKLCLQ